MKNNIALILIQVISSIAFLLSTVIVARYLGPEDFGDFSAAYSVASVAYIICLLGADVTAVNVIAVAVKAQKQGVIKAFVIYVFVVVILLSIFYYIVAIIGYWIAKDVLLLKKTHPVFVAVIFVPFMALAFFFYRVLISFFKPIIANTLFRLVLNLSMISLVLLMFIDEVLRTSHYAIILFMLAWCIAFLSMLIFLIIRLKIFSGNRNGMEYGTWLKTGVSSLPYNLALFTIPYLAVIGAEVFLSNENSVGIFATAASFSQLIANNFIACIQSVALAPIAVAIYNKNLLGIRKIFDKNLAIMGSISIFILAITYFFGKYVLLIYGREYMEGEDILLIFMLIQCVILTGCLAAPTLAYLNKNKFVAVSSMLLMLLLVCFISLFGYVFQELGIAFAVLLSVVAVFVAQNLYAYKLTFKTEK